MSKLANAALSNAARALIKFRADCPLSAMKWRGWHNRPSMTVYPTFRLLGRVALIRFLWPGTSQIARAKRRGGSRRISPSCRSCWAGKSLRRPLINQQGFYCITFGGSVPRTHNRASGPLAWPPSWPGGLLLTPPPTGWRSILRCPRTCAF